MHSIKSASELNYFFNSKLIRFGILNWHCPSIKFFGLMFYWPSNIVDVVKNFVT